MNQGPENLDKFDFRMNIGKIKKVGAGEYEEKDKKEP